MDELHPTLVRADSWALQGAGPSALLKTVSDVFQQELPGPRSNYRDAPYPGAVHSKGDVKYVGAVQVTHLATEHRAANSTDSTSTAHEDAAQGPGGDIVAPILSPLRQISLDVIAATAVLGRPMPERQNLFQDVLEQLATKDEVLQGGSGLYTMPSSAFLENLLQEMDSKSASTGQRPGEPPLYLPLDTFDMPHDQGPLSGLVPTPFDVLAQRQYGGPEDSRAAAVRLIAAQQQQQQSRLGGAQYITQQHSSAGFGSSSGYGVSKPAAGGPVRKAGALRPAGAPRHSNGAAAAASHHRSEDAYGDLDDYDEPQVSIQTSKSGRVRKVASFTGIKRKQDHGVALHTTGSAPSILGGGASAHGAGRHHDGSESDGGSALNDDSCSEASRGGTKVVRKPSVAKASSKKGKRTVCLNCGCHQTPQWRCGPLGPRTLCNACGVRCKKGLPLNCWPLREGMVLPPGAVLPADVHVPAGMNIILQPAESE